MTCRPMELVRSRQKTIGPGEASTIHTDPVAIEAGEVWIKITAEPNSHLEENCDDVELEIELQLTVL